MLPLYLAAAGAIQEATAGKEQQQRDAQLKATAYRMLPYLKTLNPESFKVHQSDPLKGAVGGLGAGADIEGMMGAGSFLNSSADKNAYDIGALDAGKINGENLDLSGAGIGQAGADQWQAQREPSGLSLFGDRKSPSNLSLSGERKTPYAKLSLTNGYPF